MKFPYGINWTLIGALAAITGTLIAAYGVWGPTSEKIDIQAINPQELTLHNKDVTFNVIGKEFNQNTRLIAETGGSIPIILSHNIMSRNEITATLSRETVIPSFGNLDTPKAKNFSICVQDGYDGETRCLPNALNLLLLPLPELEKASIGRQNPPSVDIPSELSIPTIPPYDSRTLLREETVKVYACSLDALMISLIDPIDLNDDGLCEDINGNGRLDFDDNYEFFQIVEEATRKNTPLPSWLDFNGDKQIDMDDVESHFSELVTRFP